MRIVSRAVLLHDIIQSSTLSNPMATLFFLRHGTRADHAPASDPPLVENVPDYDPLVARSAQDQMKGAAQQIAGHLSESPQVFIHFSPYLRCCQSADLLALALLGAAPAAKIQLLCDFGLSEWLHDKMKHPPPFADSTEAYKMYVPNVRRLQNKRMCLNFRPTTQLGPWNEAGLLHSEYRERCQRYFERLIATYDAQPNATIVVVGHGYGVTNFLAFFLLRPVFAEFPEGGMCWAAREDGEWRLKGDCLGLLSPDEDAALNLHLDIVYYKTNFVKKEEADEERQFPAIGFGGLRRLFRVLPAPENGPKRPGINPLCPSALSWTPQQANTFRIKSEFRLKAMHDDVFKQAFDITNPPSHPVTPEVSPLLAPARTNSTIDLAKLNSNEEIFRPLRLRYLLALDIPVHYLNYKANLSGSVNSISSVLNSRTNSAFNSHVSSHVNLTETGSASPEDVGELPNINDVISSLARVRLLQRRRALLPQFGKIVEQGEAEAKNERLDKTDKTDKTEKNEKTEKRDKSDGRLEFPRFGSPGRLDVSSPGRVENRPRRTSSSLRFIPTLEKAKVFNLESESSDSEDDRPDLTWFGKNLDGSN